LRLFTAGRFALLAFLPLIATACGAGNARQHSFNEPRALAAGRCLLFGGEGSESCYGPSAGRSVAAHLRILPVDPSKAVSSAVGLALNQVIVGRGIKIGSAQPAVVAVSYVFGKPSQIVPPPQHPKFIVVRELPSKNDGRKPMESRDTVVAGQSRWYGPWTVGEGIPGRGLITSTWGNFGRQRVARAAAQLLALAR
jgi:hypothetical protein